MRWDDFRSSDNVEDRRGGGGGGGFGIPMGGGGLGIGAIIVLTLAGWALGIDPRILIGAGESMMGGGAPQEQTQRAPQGRTGAPPDDRAGQFAAKVLGNTEDVWKVVLPEQINKPYAAPKMVIYSGATRSRCGGARSQMGPFYCPIDQTVYIDLSFFQEMQRKFRAGGDFAYAYVIAHEVGHHVQNQLGLLQKAQARQREIGEPEANQISVRVELMADCLAGVWAKNSDQKYHFLEEGDVEQAMKAAEAIGDDRLQKQAQGYAVPDSFTHGSSAQRVRWFMNGLKNGQVQQCDTFRAARL